MQQTGVFQSITIQVTTWGRLVATAGAHMTEHLYVGVTTVILPVMATALGLNLSQVGLLVSARSLVAGFSNIPSGVLADLVNKRSVLLGLSLAILGLSTLLMSYARDFWTLLLFMGLSGIGAGGFHPQSLAILSSAYRDRRALALGVHDSAGNLGEVLAPLTIGFLLTSMDWRSTLQIWAIPGLAIGLSYALLSRETNDSALPRAKWGRSMWEDVITNRAVLGVFLISVFRTMGQVALVTFLPLYLTLGLKLSVGTMGFYVSLLFLFAGMAPSISGWASDRMGRVPMMIAGSALSAISIATIPYLSAGLPLALGCAVVGIALWALRPVIFAAAMEVTPLQLAGSLVGFIFTGNMGLSFIAPILVGMVGDAYGLERALVFIAVFPLLACLIALTPLVRKRKEI